MFFEQSFEVPLGLAEARAKAAEYIKLMGYQPDGSGRFIRGGGIKTLLSLNPREWKTVLTIEISLSPAGISQLNLTLDVSSAGHLITRNDRVYWGNEFELLQASLLQGEFQGNNLILLARQVAARKKFGVALTIGGMIAGGVLISVIGQDMSKGVYGMFAGAVVGSFMRNPFANWMEKRVQVNPEMQAAREPKQENSDLNATYGHKVIDIQQKFHHSLRSWGIWLIVSGILSLFSFRGTGAISGVTSIILGVASFGFSTPAMHIVYGVLMVWSGLFKSFGFGLGAATIFGLLQIGIGVAVFLQFRRFNRAYQMGQFLAKNPTFVPIRQVEILSADRNANSLPWISLVIGIVGVTIFFVGFLALIMMQSTASIEVKTAIDFVVQSALALGLIGFGIGLGSLIVHKHRMVVGVLGTLLNGLLVTINAIWLSLLILSSR
jgi:hypothetical protein